MREYLVEDLSHLEASPGVSENPLAASVAAYLDAVLRGERREAIGVALRLLDRGFSPETVITDLLSRAQVEVGDGWADGRWSVVMEHRASAITESALHAVSDTAMRSPGAVVEGSAGQTVVACSEGEWHILPGQMASEMLRIRGVGVSFIGPSFPADELAAFFDDDPSTAVALTCSMPSSLAGTWRTISALRALGKTIVCGGRGFGPNGRWALALGADHWAPSIATGADMLIAAMGEPGPAPRKPVGTPEVIAELRALRREHPLLVVGGTSNALDRWPALRESDPAVRATREDLDSTLLVISAATIVGDPELVTNYVTWFESVLAARDLPLSFVSAGFTLLLEVIPSDLTHARAMAQAGLESCSA